MFASSKENMFSDQKEISYDSPLQRFILIGEQRDVNKIFERSGFRTPSLGFSYRIGWLP